MPHEGETNGSGNVMAVDNKHDTVSGLSRNGNGNGKPSMAVIVADRIRQAIVNADFDFGEALSEENLAAAFEVSRTPVREALSMLQVEGLVNIVPKSGTYVFTPGADDIFDLCQYRAGLELQAADLAMARDPDGLAERLEAITARMHPAGEAGALRHYGQLDNEYHLAFIEAAGNRYLTQGYRLIMGRVATLRTHLMVLSRGQPENIMQDHDLMTGLVRRRRLQELKSVLEAHVMDIMDNYHEVFRADTLRPLTQKEILRRKLQGDRTAAVRHAWR